MKNKIRYERKCPKCLMLISYTDRHLTIVCEPYEDKGMYNYKYLRCPFCGAKLVAGKEKVKTV